VVIYLTGGSVAEDPHPLPPFPPAQTCAVPLFITQVTQSAFSWKFTGFFAEAPTLFFLGWTAAEFFLKGDQQLLTLDLKPPCLDV
jgi:hypothetical protein